jgi:hypothetical protein
MEVFIMLVLYYFILTISIVVSLFISGACVGALVKYWGRKPEMCEVIYMHKSVVMLTNYTIDRYIITLKSSTSESSVNVCVPESVYFEIQIGDMYPYYPDNFGFVGSVGKHRYNTSSYAIKSLLAVKPYDVLPKYICYLMTSLGFIVNSIWFLLIASRNFHSGFINMLFLWLTSSIIFGTMCTVAVYIVCNFTYGARRNIIVSKSEMNDTCKLKLFNVDTHNVWESVVPCNEAVDLKRCNLYSANYQRTHEKILNNTFGYNVLLFAVVSVGYLWICVPYLVNLV